MENYDKYSDQFVFYFSIFIGSILLLNFIFSLILKGWKETIKDIKTEINKQKNQENGEVFKGLYKDLKNKDKNIMDNMAKRIRREDIDKEEDEKSKK